MFTILNRLRGKRGYFAKINAIVIAIAIYILYGNPYVSLASGLGYLLGESFGWGEWVGNLAVNKYNITDTIGKEGKNNGIQWIAKKIVPNYLTNYIRYCNVALAIRGSYWWLPTLLPLYFVGFNLGYLLLAAILLSIGFPIACWLGYKTESKFSFKYMYGGWAHQEVWYGLIQDIILISLIIIK